MMEKTNREQFEGYWNKFITRLRGQLIMEAKKQKLSYPMVKLMLTDHIGFWEGRQNEGGRWMNSYEANHPETAEKIRRILVEDMCFSEEFRKESHADLLKYAVPAAGAAVGLVISQAMGASPFIKAVSAAAPAAVSFPFADGIAQTAQEQQKKDLINFYLNQLQKYKESVERILDSGDADE